VTPIVHTADPHFLRYLARIESADIHPGGASASRALVRALDLSPGMSVLEVGCGTGRTLLRLVGKADVDLIGIDAMPEMLQAAEARLRRAGVSDRVRLLQSPPGRAFPLPPNSVDRVVGESVVCWQIADDARALLGDMAAVLRPGGRCVLVEAVWRAGTPDDMVERIYSSSIRDFGLCQASPQNWAAERWCQEMHRTGFRVVAAPALNQVIGEVECQGDERRVSDRRTWRQLRARVTAGGVRAWFRYHRALRLHRNDGCRLDTRLFVLEKPGGGG
jgi:ubiquinone/menaquinone biosynthesis C-methylase UbiE